MQNKIDDLRNHLFAALEGLADKEEPMELERARAIADVARVIVDSAKAETAFLQATGRREGTGFIRLTAEAPPAPATEQVPRLVRRVVGASESED